MFGKPKLYSAPESRLAALKSYLRIFLYRLFGMKIGNNCYVGSIRFRRAAYISIGPNCVIHDSCRLWPTDAADANPKIIIGFNNALGIGVAIEAHDSVCIGDNNIFGPDVFVIDSDHDCIDGIAPINQTIKAHPVSIGNGCWIGARVIILKGVDLGDGCVVGAGAVVTRSFGPNSVIGGVPARLLHMRGEA